MSVVLRKPMTQDEFLAWAERQDGRYEFDGTQPVAMVGGTNNHGLISRNLNGQLYLRLRGKTCQSMTADGGGIVTIGHQIRYPEAVVSCTPFDGLKRLFPDPVVVFEVVSESTRRIDQVLKLREYHAVPSIKRYVLIEQAGCALTVHCRQADEPWRTMTLIEGDNLLLPEIGIEIPIDDLYEGVVFTAG